MTRAGAPAVEWLDESHFVVGGTSFQTITEDLASLWALPDPGHLHVAKYPWMIDRYVEMVAALQPRRILELGIYRGGSTALFAALAEPELLVAVDLKEWPHDQLDGFIADNDLGGTVRTFYDVDQSDRARVADVVDSTFGQRPLDLILDDCSHLYEPTRASFNALFPRLRPGGLYVIEDWPWAHTEVGVEPIEGYFPEEVPLTVLLYELVLAIPSVRDAIAELRIDRNSILVRRGAADLDREIFDISACSNQRGRDLLPPT